MITLIADDGIEIEIAVPWTGLVLFKTENVWRTTIYGSSHGVQSVPLL